MGLFGQFARMACSHARVRPGLARPGCIRRREKAEKAAGNDLEKLDLKNRPSRSGCQPRRFPVAVCAEMARRAAPPRRRDGAARAVRRRPRRLRVARRAAIARHRRCRPRPRGPCPAGRDQPRHQPCGQADERPCAIWRDRRLDLAARLPSRGAPAIARITRSPNSWASASPASRRRTFGS